MKLLVALCFSAIALSLSTSAAPQDAKPASSNVKDANNAKNAKAETPEKPLTAIPASAVQIEPGAYRYTDANGKKWILFQTPFGIAKKEDTGEPLRKKQHEAQTMQGVKITEDGDSLKFEREGPFGTYKWSKKKTELSDEEKAAWQSQKDKPAGESKNAAAKQDR
jgi:hypothetical protein